MSQPTRWRRAGPSARPSSARPGTWLLVGAMVLLVLVSLPVVLRGAPLADDFVRCRRYAELGLGGQLEQVLAYRGLVRPFRFLEVTLVGGLCGRLPFGLVMLPGLGATLWAGWLLRGLLADLGVSSRWAAVGGAAWLLHPVGLESALWPSAMHVPLGLALSLVALRAARRGGSLTSAIASLGAMACVEQAIFALPLLVAVVAPADRRRRVTVSVVAVSLALLLVYLAVPGGDERTAMGLADRVRAPLQELRWYAVFPAVGVGVPAGVGALRWSAPWGGALVLCAGAAGALLGMQAGGWRGGKPLGWRQAALVAVGMVALLAVANLPSIVTVPRDTSPRIFSPSWLLLSAFLGIIGEHIRWRRGAILGGVLGLGAGLSLLSLAFAASVRVRHADASADILDELASRTPEGGRIVLCDVPPKLVEPAPAGAFSLHDLFYDWAAEPALRHLTGREATITVAWEGEPCPSPADADVRAELQDLLEGRR